jgi:hypothetical protein
MPDLGSVVQGLAALKQASEIVKALADTNALYEKAELKLKIAELTEAVMTARVALLEAQTEIQSLKDQIGRLTTAAQATVVKRDNVYFLRENDQEVGPFCPRCFEADKRRMPLTPFTPAFRTFGKYNCPQCKSTY